MNPTDKNHIAGTHVSAPVGAGLPAIPRTVAKQGCIAAN